MNTALIEVNSTDPVVKRAKLLCTIIEKGAAKFSDREAEFISFVLDGTILAVKKIIMNLENDSYHRLIAIIELESTSGTQEETTYLDTQSMNIMYSPPYLPDDDIANNYTSKSFYGTRPGIYVTLKRTSPHHNKSVWVITPTGSSTAFVVRNYATPGATMQFNFNPSKNWWDITFDNNKTYDIFINDGDNKRAALSTKIDDKTIYLVNISAIKGEATDSRNAIVGATEDMVRTSVKMWKLETVTDRVKDEYPIGIRFQHLIPIIGGIHMNTQPDENDAAVEYPSFCSLT